MPDSIFQGRLASGVTEYFEVPIRDGTIGLHVGWFDATSSATITIELTSVPGVAVNSTTAWHWKDSGVSITGPAGSAIGAASINIENVRQIRARIKIVTAAITQLGIWERGA